MNDREMEVATLVGALVESGRQSERRLRDAVFSVLERDLPLARVMADEPREAYARRDELDALCAALLGGNGPDPAAVRIVTRAIEASLHIDRIGELAGNIARRSLDMGGDLSFELPSEIHQLALSTLRQVAWALAALEDRDARFAEAVRQHDRQTDAANRAVFARLIEYAHANPGHFDAVLACTSVSRYLERAADHAVGVADLALHVGGAAGRMSGIRCSAIAAR